MGRFNKKIVVDEKILKDTLTWLNTQKTLFEDPIVVQELSLMRKQALKLNLKMLKKHIKKIEDLLE